MANSEATADVRLEMWYLDFMLGVSKSLRTSVDNGWLSGEKAITILTDVTLKTIQYGVVVK